MGSAGNAEVSGHRREIHFSTFICADVSHNSSRTRADSIWGDVGEKWGWESLNSLKDGRGNNRRSTPEKYR